MFDRHVHAWIDSLKTEAKATQRAARRARSDRTRALAWNLFHQQYDRWSAALDCYSDGGASDALFPVAYARRREDTLAELADE